MAREGHGDAYAPRGGSAITDNCRAVLTLTTLDQEQIGDVLPGVVVPPDQLRELLVLRAPKVNSAPPQLPTEIQRIPTRWGIALRIFDSPIPKSPEETRRVVRRAIGEHLRELTIRFEGTLTESKLGAGLYSDVPNLSKGHVPRPVQELVEDGFVHRADRSSRGGGKVILPGPRPNPTDEVTSGGVQEPLREGT